MHSASAVDVPDLLVSTAVNYGVWQCWKCVYFKYNFCWLC